MDIFGFLLKFFKNQKKIKCLVCHTEIDIEQERCHKCGERIKSMFGKQCPNCNELNELNDKKCIKCGFDFELNEKGEEIIKCPVCGYSMKDEHTQCPACGAKFL